MDLIKAKLAYNRTSRNLRMVEQGRIPSRTYAYDNDKREREEGTIGAMQQIDKIYNRIIGLS